ncbi:MAG: hypothetical protein J3Q66DRAFT_425818 [Benniella sp.]|nr:MAG: hypothetical protein J3Q66DRAFT_425818 [Benniella sp.]
MVVAETMSGKVYQQLADGYVQAHSANAFSAITEAVFIRGRSQRPFSEAVLRGFSDRLQADASSADTSILSAAVALPSSSQASRTTTTEEEAAAVEKIKNITQKDLESFQQQVFSSQALARFECPMGIGVLRQDRCLARRTQGAGRLAGSHTFGSDFKIPSCHMIHTNLEVRNPSSSEISVFTGRIHSLVSLIRITPTTAARHTAVVALASLFGVDWSRGPTVTSSGSHGLLSYLASPINPRAMASVKNPAPLTLIELSELSSISITAATASGVGNCAKGSTILCYAEDSGRASAEEAFVGEWGLGRILSLGGLLTAVGGDQALAELDKVRGLEGPPKRVSLPGARVVDHLESCHTDPSPSLEVLQLIFLDTLSNHMRSYGQGRVSPAVGSTSGKTKKTNQGLAEDAKELLNDLRSVIPQKSSLRLSWLQRIMDVLVLMSSQDESFERGVILLLKGAVLLWWDEQDIGTHGYREVKGRGRIDDQDQVSVKASSTKDGDMEASLGRKLDMISRDEIGQCDWMIVEKQKKWDPVGHGLASLTFYHCQLATRTIRTNTLRTHFKTLVELRIHPCTPVSSDTVLDVLSACPVLEVLHVRYLSAEVITERGPWTCQHRLRELTAGIQAGQDEEALQPLVFERLAALTRLKMLEILTPIPNSRRSMLGFRLECGLGQLAHWQHLSVLRFSMEWYNINTPQVGMDDVAWMGLDSSRRLNQDRDFDAAGNLPRKKILAMADDHLEHGDAKPIAKIGSRPTAQVAPEAVPDHSAETHGRLGTQRTELGVDLESRSCTV